MSDKSYETLIKKFHRETGRLLEWCRFNRLDINLKKTFIMFVTNKRIKPPKSILTNESIIEVVSRITILGVIVDNKLNFMEYAASLRLTVNKKLFSIKKIFYLSVAVKIQFFKSFILPYFDYCISLTIYFPKATIQKINNCYNNCLLILFKFKPNEGPDPSNNFNNFLEKYGLSNFQHRVILRIMIFIHKIVNKSDSPPFLKNSILKCNFLYPIRNVVIYKIPYVRTHYGENTFSFFINVLLNNFLNDDISLEYNFFKKRIFNNINLIFSAFITVFTKFNLTFKRFI